MEGGEGRGGKGEGRGGEGIGDGWERGKWRGGEEGIQMREGRRETAMYFPVILVVQF